MTNEILLNAFTMNCPGHQSCGLWRHPRDRSREYLSMKHWQNLARTLERGLFDGVFLADVSGLYDVYRGNPDTALRGAAQVPANDPFSVVPIMAAVTEHLCFGVTGSIPYEPPYAFARRISTLDHLTQGRIAWNVVTGYLDSAAKGVGKKSQTGHDTRYEIADEYMEVVYKLWEGSWEDDAVVVDREKGVFTDPRKVHRVDHKGEYFELSATHLCEPSPQRTPVIFQAGGSPAGQAFAARHAECVFIGQSEPNAAKAAVSALRAQAVANGRSAQDLRIFSLLAVVVGETDAEAQARYEEYQSYGLPEAGLALMSGWSGIDLSQFDPDARAENLSSEALHGLLKALGTKTIREWGESLVVGGAAGVFVGSPSSIADQMQNLVEISGIDGFNLAYTVLPECFEDFVDVVVPELQRRGVYKTCYAEGSMREKLFGRGSRVEPSHPAARHRRA